MYARTTTVRGDPRAIDEGIAFVRDEVWTAIRDMDGAIGISMLADRDAGRCIVTTAWSSQDAMHTTADAVRDIRRQAAEVLRADAVDVAEWEIAVMHRTHPAGDHACARVIWCETEPGQMDSTTEAFRMSWVPRLDDLPGFCSVSLLTDRLTNSAVAAVTYADRAALDRAGERGAALREEFSQAMGVRITEVAAMDLPLAHLRVPELV